MKGRHVHARHLHAGVGAFGGGHDGGDGIEIPLHGHADYVIGIGKLRHRYIVAIFGVLLGRFTDQMIPQERRTIEFPRSQLTIVDVIDEIIDFLPTVDSAVCVAHAPAFPVIDQAMHCTGYIMRRYNTREIHGRSSVKHRVKTISAVP